MRMRFESAADAPSVVARGAAPVGHLHELPPVELAAILFMRWWCEGGPSSDQIERDFRRHLGLAAAASALADFDALMKITSTGVRRPLALHGVGCRCYGGDESALANMVAAAAAGDRDEAMLFAGILMTGPAAFAAVRLAGSLGRVFLRIARTPPMVAPAGAPPTIHGPSPSSSRH